jgi:hypothetical protein
VEAYCQDNPNTQDIAVIVAACETQYKNRTAAPAPNRAFAGANAPNAGFNHNRPHPHNNHNNHNNNETDDDWIDEMQEAEDNEDWDDGGGARFMSISRPSGQTLGHGVDGGFGPGGAAKKALRCVNRICIQ